MPPQLARGKRQKRKQPALTIELLPAISIHDLRKAIPRDYSTNIYQNRFRYPQISRLDLTYHQIAITDHAGRVQTFGLQWIPTYFGPHRALFQCGCGRCAVRLFAHYGSYKCRWCHRAIYTSQRNNSQGRKRLTACKLRLELGSLPNINEPLAPKPKWTHRKTYQRLRSQVQALEAKAKRTPFRKPVNISIFPYHLP